MQGLLKKLKARLAHDSLRPPNHKGYIAYIKRKIRNKKVIPKISLSLFVNRYCNLKCFSCGALGMNPEPDETSIENIILFLDRFKTYEPDSTIIITGGEPTMINRVKLKTICDKIHEIGYKVGMLTNGYILHPLEWFDYVNLDNHGVNARHLVKWRIALKRRGRWYEETDKTYHQDMPYAMRDNITQGFRCTSLMRPLTLWKDVIYPCCNSMCVEWWINNYDVTRALRKARWTIYNPDILKTVRDWRETLPPEFYRLCTIKCWRHATKAKWTLIT